MNRKDARRYIILVNLAVMNSVAENNARCICDKYWSTLIWITFDFYVYLIIKSNIEWKQRIYNVVVNRMQISEINKGQLQRYSLF